MQLLVSMGACWQPAQPGLGEACAEVLVSVWSERDNTMKLPPAPDSHANTYLMLVQPRTFVLFTSKRPYGRVNQRSYLQVNGPDKGVTQKRVPCTSGWDNHIPMLGRDKEMPM